MCGCESGSAPGGPRKMMQGMMARMREGGLNPMEMCRMMSGSVARAAEMATWATPELRGLFEDWVGEVKEEILTHVRAAGGPVDLETLAGGLDLGTDSITFLVANLAREGRIRLAVSAPPETEDGPGGG